MNIFLCPIKPLGTDINVGLNTDDRSRTSLLLSLNIFTMCTYTNKNIIHFIHHIKCNHGNK
jgi:hypothetical protein